MATRVIPIVLMAVTAEVGERWVLEGGVVMTPVNTTRGRGPWQSKMQREYRRSELYGYEVKQK